MENNIQNSKERDWERTSVDSTDDGLKDGKIKKMDE